LHVLGDTLRHEDLTGGCLRAQAGGQVERRATVAVLHRDGLATVDPHADRQGELGILVGGFQARQLELEPCPDCLWR
jgi:hypothetical protein